MAPRRRKLVIIGVVLIVSTAAILLVNPLRTMYSFKKIPGYPLYSMTYFGRAYDHLRFTVPQSEEELESVSLHPFGGYRENQACTVFTATGGDKMIYGRNRDLYDKNRALLLFTNPPGGYKSVSIVDLNQLGLILEEDQESISFSQRILLMAAPLLPTEGMNEFGLTIAKADVPTGDIRPFDPAKQSLLFRTAMRVVLDHAKTTGEAIDLLSQYNIAFGVYGGHFLIADPTGDSAIVEYFDNQVQVIRAPDPWQVITNFSVGQLEEGETPTCERYLVTEQSLEEYQGKVSTEEAMAILKDASIPETLWSIVYNMTDLTLDIALYRDYNTDLQVSPPDW